MEYTFLPEKRKPSDFRFQISRYAAVPNTAERNTIWIGPHFFFLSRNRHTTNRISSTGCTGIQEPVDPCVSARIRIAIPAEAIIATTAGLNCPSTLFTTASSENLPYRYASSSTISNDGRIQAIVHTIAPGNPAIF